MDDTLGRDQGHGEADGCGGASEGSGSHDPIELVVFSKARRPFGFGRSAVLFVAAIPFPTGLSFRNPKTTRTTTDPTDTQDRGPRSMLARAWMTP